MSTSELSGLNKRAPGSKNATDPWAGFLSYENTNHIFLSLNPWDYYFGPQSQVKPDVEPPPVGNPEYPCPFVIDQGRLGRVAKVHVMSGLPR